jgi:hypothetical protein
VYVSLSLSLSLSLWCQQPLVLAFKTDALVFCYCSCGSVVCVIPVYLIGGALIKWKVYDAEPMSIDIIPNVSFWGALPFLVKDGFVYFLNKVSGGRICSE